MPEYVVPCYVDGKWIETAHEESLQEPYRNEIVGKAYVASPALVDDAVQSAASMRETMANMPAHERAQVLSRVSTKLDERRDELAGAMAVQAGKPLRECRVELERSISTLKLTAEEARKVETEVLPLDAVSAGVGKLGFTLRFPLGIIGVITPFNAPINLACHKLGPALAAGNCVVFKPPLEVSVASKMLVEVFLDGGVPEKAIQLINGAAETGDALVSHPLIDMVSFTGSGRTATHIVKTAGLKRTLFELGGTAATIVHGDANMDKAIGEVVGAAFGLTGQSCVSTQRAFIHRDVLDEFVSGAVDKTKKLIVGDPRDSTTDIGTLITEDAAKRVETWINEAISEGAQLLVGGKRYGAVVEPTILLEPDPKSKVVCEEVFGPTMAVIPYEEIDQAFEAMNDTPWGLQTGIFTSSLDIALKAARRLRAGGVNINGPSRGRTDLQPFGGVKQSGWGREGPRYAIREMTELRMIVIAPAS